ncbi:hypothetical protein [Bradyrhizobium sp.]|jgi:hypothetical protein|uniref:hypothetical protein n=1 Tax=Bradyrhizobium sp. TaxID=376 RepID=UPI002BEC247C|nr:hypothetical protein [Bradyrhizobium sp.]HWX62034.1 hypothetical protein [Bradyrhizobium sp.]
MSINMASLLDSTPFGTSARLAQTTLGQPPLPVKQFPDHRFGVALKPIRICASTDWLIDWTIHRPFPE